MSIPVESRRLLVLQRVHSVDADVLRGYDVPTAPGQPNHASQYAPPACTHLCVSLWGLGVGLFGHARPG